MMGIGHQRKTPSRFSGSLQSSLLSSSQVHSQSHVVSAEEQRPLLEHGALSSSSKSVIRKRLKSDPRSVDY